MDQTGVLANLPTDANVSVTTRQTAPEIQELLSQIPDWLKQRQAAINDITRAYDDNPNAKQNGTQAFIKGALMSGTQDAKEMAKNAVDGERAQNDYNLANRVARGNAILKGLDLNAMDNIASQTMRASISGANGRKTASFPVQGGLYQTDLDVPGSGRWLVSPTSAKKAHESLLKMYTEKSLKDGTFGKPGNTKEELSAMAEQEALRIWSLPEGPEKDAQLAQIEYYSTRNNPKISPPGQGTGVPGDPSSVPTTGQTGAGDRKQVTERELMAYLNMAQNQRKLAKTPEQRQVLDSEIADISTKLKEMNPSATVALSDPVANTNAVKPTFFGPQEEKVRDQLGKNQADENAADQSALEESLKMEQTLIPMGEIIRSGKNTAGQLHEKVSALGNLIAYVDPKHKLAEAASNDQVYFSKLMDAVREKIKALGSGTAVSNLDLIVSQKSVGDLRNNPEGLKKLLTLMELSNYTLQDKIKAKLGYWDQGKTYDGYRGSADPTNIVRIEPKPDGTANYWIQSRGDWIKEKAKRMTSSKVPLEEATKIAEREFARAARQATANIVAGTGYEMRKEK